MENRLLDFGLVIKYKVDRYDRIPILLDSYKILMDMHGTVNEDNFNLAIKDDEISDIYNKMFGDLSNCFAMPNDLTDKDDIPVMFGRACLMLAKDEPVEYKHHIGTTHMFVFDDCLGVFDDDYRPLGYLYSDEDMDGMFAIASLHPAIFTHMDDVWNLVNDPVVMEVVYNTLNTDWDSRRKENMN